MLWKSVAAISALAFMLAMNPAHAKLTKYWVLKVVGNANPIYTAFKSKEACEAEKRRILNGMKKLQKQFGGANGISFETTAKCLDHIPYGYERPRF